MNIYNLPTWERGCGTRKEGGFYLVSGDKIKPCGKLPFLAERCPCGCFEIKATRGYQWVKASILNLGDINTCSSGQKSCLSCVMERKLDPSMDMLLDFVGASHYRNPDAFIKESQSMRISRRINPQMLTPSFFEKWRRGGVWVALGHRHAVIVKDGNGMPFKDPETGKFITRQGIFGVYKIHGIDYVVREEDSPEYLEELERKGIRLTRHTLSGDPKYYDPRETKGPGEKADEYLRQRALNEKIDVAPGLFDNLDSQIAN